MAFLVTTKGAPSSTLYAAVWRIENGAIGSKWCVSGANANTWQANPTAADQRLSLTESTIDGASTNDNSGFYTGTINHANFNAYSGDLLVWIWDASYNVKDVGSTCVTSGQTISIHTIYADTNELQTDWANGGRLDTILDTAAGQATSASTAASSAAIAAAAAETAATSAAASASTASTAAGNANSAVSTLSARFDSPSGDMYVYLENEFNNITATADLGSVPSDVTAIKGYLEAGGDVFDSIDRIDTTLKTSGDLYTKITTVNTSLTASGDLYAKITSTHTTLAAAGDVFTRVDAVYDATRDTANANTLFGLVSTVATTLDDTPAGTLHAKIDAIKASTEDGGAMYELVESSNTSLVSGGTATALSALQTTLADGGDHYELVEGISTSLASGATYTTLQSIVGDTNELQTDWRDGGRLDNLLDNINAGGSVVNVSPLGVSQSRTWVLNRWSDAIIANNVVEVGEGAAVVLSMDFGRVLNHLGNAQAWPPDTSLASVVSAVDITGDPALTFSNVQTSQNRLQAHFTVSSGLVAGNSHTVKVTVTTTDGQTLIGKGLLQVL